MPRLAGAALMVAVFAVEVCLWGQQSPPGFPQKMTLPPATQPLGCPDALVAGLQDARGTPEYRSMRREIAALKLGHSASAKMQSALALEGKPGGSLLHAVIPMMTALANAQNEYLCASFVMGQGLHEETSRRDQIVLLISVYNRMALQTWELENVFSSEAAGAETKNGSAAQAGKTASILQDRKEAGADLVRVAVKDEALLIDTEGPGGAQTDWLRITCAERNALLGELLPLAKSAAVDEFTVAASLFADFFQKPHKCMA